MTYYTINVTKNYKYSEKKETSGQKFCRGQKLTTQPKFNPIFQVGWFKNPTRDSCLFWKQILTVGNVCYQLIPA